MGIFQVNEHGGKLQTEEKNAKKKKTSEKL